MDTRFHSHLLHDIINTCGLAEPPWVDTEREARTLSPQDLCSSGSGVGTAKHLRPKGKRGEGDARERERERGRERKGGRNPRKSKAVYARNAILGVRKGAKQSNVNRINVNTDFFFLPGHVSAAGERCLDCVVAREGDPGAVD